MDIDKLWDELMASLDRVLEESPLFGPSRDAVRAAIHTGIQQGFTLGRMAHHDAPPPDGLIQLTTDEYNALLVRLGEPPVRIPALTNLLAERK